MSSIEIFFWSAWGRLGSASTLSTLPPKVLENHFDTAVFSESQNYGRDKAKFALITGLVKRAITSAFIYTGPFMHVHGISEARS